MEIGKNFPGAKTRQVLNFRRAKTLEPVTFTFI